PQEGSYNSQADSARDRGKSKGGGRMNEEISSDSESESLAPRRTEEEEQEELEETAQEKKLRLAKLYLEQLRQQEDEKAEAREFEEDQVAGRLKEDVLEQRGRLQKSVAKEIQVPAPADIRVLRGHQLSITCLVITPDDLAIFSAAKDCTIIKWSVESGRKLHVIPRAKKGAEGQPPGHSSHVLCMAISSDGKYLASGDRSKLILIWEAPSCRHLYTFTGHRDAVSVRSGPPCGTFRERRAAGPGDGVGTVRVWKIPEESQLVFYGHQGSIDNIQLINEEHMVSGADDGSLALWVRLWRCGEGFRQLDPLCDIPLVGFINSLKFSSAGDFLVAGVGQEHRLGRWWRIKEARNSVCIIPLRRAPRPTAAGS
ncbi:PREDICTED: U3 small nucleolar RNA-interacting protein 2, partial [Myotis brandtii]|uniref:U3 small nucleolar RNA-interacting protein 2 n=1 Tax=Myotis brandtii TaxID=109478 RepID=UPI000703F41F